MDIANYTKQQGTFLKAADIDPTQMWEITAEGSLVTSEKFGNERLHLPVKCGEDEKIFDCSKTNARFISDTLGNDTSKWVGKMLSLEVYKTKTSDGKMVDAINVKAIR